MALGPLAPLPYENAVRPLIKFLLDPGLCLGWQFKICSIMNLIFTDLFNLFHRVANTFLIINGFILFYFLTHFWLINFFQLI